MTTKPSNPAPALERDPVCGMNVNPATAKHVYGHGGKNYFFCCAPCVEKFKADPAKYLNAPVRSSGLVTLGAAKPTTTSDRHPQSPQPPSPGAAVVAYVCPMLSLIHI